MKRKVFSTVLSLSMALSAFSVYHSESVHAESLSSIKKKQQENAKKAESTKSQLDANKSDQASVNAEIARLDKLSSQTDDQITQKQKDISNNRRT
jgi:uncharacterized protein HemX